MHGKYSRSIAGLPVAVIRSSQIRNEEEANMNGMRMSSALMGMLGILILFGPFSVFAEDPSDPARGQKVFKLCSTCHQVGESAKNAFGPVLNNIVGRKAGSYPGYSYSPSLQEANMKGLTWTEDLLFQWLHGPSDFVKDYLKKPDAASKMSIMVADPQQRRDVIAYLATVTHQSTSQDTAGHDMSMMHLASKDDKDPVDKLPRVKLELVAPPFLPKHTQTTSDESKVVEVDLTVQEKKWVLDDVGTEIVALTYNGSIPAPAIVVHEGDYVELTLKNPSTNMMEHNIDLHAVTGKLGGAAITTVTPGNEAVMRFKATKSGTFLYHCAPEGVMTPYHVTHGMTGVILVLPRKGLTDDQGNPLTYDRAYYIGENEFYVPRDGDGNFKQYKFSGEDLNDWVESMRGLIPSHIVFNGRVGALTGKGAMKAKVGERVLFLHSQGNRATQPHLIGGHADYVWETGSFASPPLKDVQTWFIRGGAAGAAIYTFRQPGLYVYLNHNLIEAVVLGAAGHVMVEGEWDTDLLKSVYHGPLKK
jgi:nitrite reductase (NO-forming)